MYSRPADHIPGSGLPVQHPNYQQYLKTLDCQFSYWFLARYTPYKICDNSAAVVAFCVWSSNF